MGRYYQGDIEGKFWFGVQSSDAADRFNPTNNEYAAEDGEICYEFSRENDLADIIEELTNIEETIGGVAMKKLDDFFDETNGYNDTIMKKHGVLDMWNEHKTNYADYYLGIKIRDYLKEHSYCAFTAEC